MVNMLCNSLQPGLTEITLPCVRVYAVSHLKDWRRLKFRGGFGYKFRALVGDHTRVIDVSSWDEGMYQFFKEAERSGEPVQIHNGYTQVRDERFANHYFTSLPTVLHVNYKSSVEPVPDVSRFIYVPTRNQLPPGELKNPLHPGATTEDLFTAFYDLDVVEKPSLEQVDVALRMPTMAEVMGSAEDTQPTQEESAWIEVDEHDADDAINNNLPFRGYRGALFDGADRSQLKPGMAFEYFYQDNFQVHGQGVIIPHEGSQEIRFLLLRHRPNHDISKYSPVYKDVNGYLLKPEDKGRIAIRRIKHETFLTWRASLHESVYKLLRAEKPQSHASVRSGRGNQRVTRSPSVQKFICANQSCKKTFDRNDSFTRHLRKNKTCCAANPGFLKVLKCNMPECETHHGFLEEVWFKKHIDKLHKGMTVDDCLLRVPGDPVSTSATADRDIKALVLQPSINGAQPFYTSEQVDETIASWPLGQPFSITYCYKEDQPRTTWTSEGYYIGKDEVSGRDSARFVPLSDPWEEIINCTENADVLALTPLPRLSVTSVKRPQENDPDMVQVRADSLHTLLDLLTNARTALDNGLREEATKAVTAALEFVSEAV